MGFVVGVLTGAGFAVMLFGSVPLGLVILAIATLSTVIALAKD